jgi:phage RecT family recombinase
MPTQRGNRASAVVRADARTGAEGEGEGPQRALVAVTREIDNRLAIISGSAAVGMGQAERERFAQRLKLVALTTFTRTPALWTCEPVSIARAIVEAGQLGLEPTGLLGGAYLVPRGGKATLLVGYRGLVMLAMRSQLVQRVEARVVRAKDTFDYGYGLEPYLHHQPSRDEDPGAYTGAYAVIFYRDGSRQFDYMSIAEIEAIRARSSSPTAGPWVSDYAEMCKKTPLRRLMKMAPLTVEVRTFIDEVDPEVIEGTAHDVTPGSARQAELRAQLQQALEREYGTAPEGGQAAAGATTQATAGAGTSGGGEAGQAATVAATAANTAGEAQEERAAGVPATAAAPPATSKPESVGQVLGTAEAPAVCGATHKGLGAGPCVEPAGHPQAEHREAGGTRWTNPNGVLHA